jgi:hypothetical protein
MNTRILRRVSDVQNPSQVPGNSESTWTKNALLLEVCENTCKRLCHNCKDCLDNPAYMARSQEFNLADNFKAVISTAAWRSKPSWRLVAAVGRTLGRTSIPTSNGGMPLVSRPKEVAALIEEAASHAR